MSLNTNYNGLEKEIYPIRLGVFRVVTIVYVMAPFLGETFNYFILGKLTPSIYSSIALSLSSISVYLWFHYKRKLHLALRINSFVQLACYSWGLLASTGIRAEHFFYMSMFPVINGFFLGRRAAIWTTIYCASFTVVLAALEHFGFMQFSQNHLVLVALQAVTSLLFMGWIVAKYEAIQEISQQELIRTIKHDQVANQRQEYILEGAGLGAWDWWLETNEVIFDKRWLEIIGLKVGEVPNDLMTWDQRTHPVDKENAYRDIRNYLEGRSPTYENIHRMKHANGSWVWILDRGKISEWDSKGKPIRFTGTHFDITKYKDQEQMSEEIQKIANIGGWELDLATGSTLWTEQTYRIHNFPLGTPTDKNSVLNRYPPHEQAVMDRNIMEGMQGKRIKSIHEFTDAYGVHKWVEVTGEPVFGADGKVLKLKGTIQDVTNSIETQQNLEKERLKSIHSSKLASLGEMSAGMAHEINNPLAIIHGNISVLNRFRMDEEKFNSKIEAIEKAVNRISKIVNGLRKFSRASDVVTMEAYCLEAIIAEAIAVTEPKAKHSGVSVELSGHSGSKILCDDIEIEQVIINLINNAIDAVKHMDNAWVRINLLESPNEVILQVIDSGHGIPHEIETKIFQPFFTTKPIGEGTGLGLSISKGILDHHNASISLNTLLENTCFEIKFKKYSNPTT